MLKRIKNSQLVQSSFAYAVANFTAALIPLGLLPILTHFLSPKQYGLYILFIITIKLILPAVTLGITESIARHYYDKEGQFSNYFNSALIIIGIMVILIEGFTYMFANTLSQLTSIPAHFLLLIPISSAFQAIMNIVLAIWQIDNKPIKFCSLRLGHIFIEAGLILCAIIIYKASWQGAYIAIAMASALMGITSLYIAKRNGWLDRKSTESKTKKILSFGLPLVPHELSGLILTFSDRILLTHLMNLSAVGLYTVNYQIGQIITLVDTAFNRAWIAWLYRTIDAGLEKNIDKVTKIALSYITLLSIFALCIWLMSSYLIDWFFSSEYQGASIVTLWIAFGFVWCGVYKLGAAFIFYAKQTKHLAWTTPTAAACNILLNFIWIPMWGITGAAIATCASFFILASLTWFFAFKIIKSILIEQSQCQNKNISS